MDKKVKKIINEYITEFKTISMTELPEREPLFMSIKSFKCQLNNGMTIVREQCLRGDGAGDVVTILPITRDNKIILVAQPRVFTPLTVGFELPAGYVDYNEAPIVAAKRELLEETGYEPQNMKNLITYQGDPGCSKAINYCFLATNCEKVQSQNLDESEYVKFLECSLDDAKELMDMGLIVGSSSIIMLGKVYENRRKYGI